LSEPRSDEGGDVRGRLEALLGTVRPDLYRYCARLVGSAFDGEDIVQDVLARALAKADELDEATRLRPWLFRVAHNRAIDHLRSQAIRRAEPIMDDALYDERSALPDEALIRREAVEIAFHRFTELPITQRSAVILKDILGHSLEEIGGLLELSTNAVKAVLSRGRARLREIEAAAKEEIPVRRAASQEARRFADLFNRRDWDSLRALLADEVRLTQTRFAERRGAADVGLFFTTYAGIADFHLVPAYLGSGRGEEVIAVFEKQGDAMPIYLMEVRWHDDRIARIRDFRHARYILEGADLTLSA
jgi:RNA polymerase sigma-70 factor (ECF subfamily)